MIKGPGVMDGYHNLPEETAKTLTSDGWLHTGDKGALDADGHLVITGRIKELFKTSGGKYIAPPAIESKFKAVCPYASQFMVFGEERNYCVALVTLDPDAMAGWAEANGMSGASYTEIVQSEAVPRRWSATTSTSSTATSTAGRPSRSGSSSTTTSRSSRASSPPR